VKREKGSLTLRLTVDNLLDENYATFGYSYPDETYTTFFSEFFPAATRTVLAGVSFTF